MSKKQKSKKPTFGELEQQIVDLTEALQRERADAVNIRRRHDEQISSLKTHVKVEIVRDLLPVIDNFERSLAHVPKDIEDNNFVKGVQAIVKQFERTLEDIGVVKIKTVGEKFDPNLHKAVEGEGETIKEEIQSGYRLGNQVINHSKVILVS